MIQNGPRKTAHLMNIMLIMHHSGIFKVHLSTRIRASSQPLLDFWGIFQDYSNRGWFKISRMLWRCTCLQLPPGKITHVRSSVITTQQCQTWYRTLKQNNKYFFVPAKRVFITPNNHKSGMMLNHQLYLIMTEFG